MSRLVSRLCDTCKEDTIHKSVIGGVMCIYCGSVFIPKAGFERKQKEKFWDIAKRNGIFAARAHFGSRWKPVNDARRKWEAETGDRVIDKPIRRGA